MLVAVDHRAAEALCQGNTFVPGLAHDDAATGDEHRVLGRGQQLDGRVQAGLAAGTAVELHGTGDFDADLAVEQVARDVELRGPKFRMGAVEAARGELGHAFVVVHVALVLGELLEHRQLVGFLETAQALAHGAGFGGDQHHRAVRPVGGGDRRDAIADAGTVLTDHHTVATTGAGIPIGHVAGALLVHHGYQPDAGGREDVHGVHERGAHDAEHVGHVVGDQGLDKGLGGRHGLDAGGNRAGGDGGLAHGLCSWCLRVRIVGMQRETVALEPAMVNKISKIRYAMYYFLKFDYSWLP